MIKKFIRGNAERGDEVIAELEKLGGTNICCRDGRDEDCFYFIDDGGIEYIEDCSILATLLQENFEEIHLSEKQEPKFDPSTLKPFDKVLVKDGVGDYWSCNLFTCLSDMPDGRCAIVCGGFFMQCVPYNEDTAHLIGTCERPPKFYDIFD